ncbi:MAG: hypothetical protein F4023_08590 [Acidobacteria bacterium]|nr:hypothetical protein [Acidobacteriota bacterium]MYK79693.1 hypothetical protein [Acidobacteriota bacterium]
MKKCELWCELLRERAAEPETAIPFGRFLRGRDQATVEAALKLMKARGLLDLDLSYGGSIQVVRGPTTAGYAYLDEQCRPWAARSWSWIWKSGLALAIIGPVIGWLAGC